MTDRFIRVAEKDIPPPRQKDEEWHRGYRSGLEFRGDFPGFFPGGEFMAFNMGFSDGLRAARATSLEVTHSGHTGDPGDTDTPS